MGKKPHHGEEATALELVGQPAVAAGLADGGHISWRRREQTRENTVRKLMRREVGGLRGRPDSALCAEKFRRFQLQEEFYVHADDTYMMHVGRNKRAITSITAANDFVFAVTYNGSCVAFRQTATGSIAPYKRDGVSYFNHLDEKIESVFYNKINDSIIIVYSIVWRRDYQMRVLPLETLRTCDDWDSGVRMGCRAKYMPLFDDCNNISIVCSSSDEDVLNVYDLKSYKLVHSFKDKNICSIAARPGKLIIVKNSINNYIPIEVWSTESWIKSIKMKYFMRLGRELQFVQLSNGTLLLKEEGEKIMQVIDIWKSNNVTEIEHTEHATLLLSVGLNSDNILLKFNNDLVVTCNCRGGQSLLLDANEMVANKSGPSLDMCVTRDKSLAILYSRKSVENLPEGMKENQAYSSIGSINISNTFNGKSIFKINPYDDPDLMVAPRQAGDTNRTSIRSSIHEALHNVTSLLYDEERHILYTGSKHGLVHMWSN